MHTGAGLEDTQNPGDRLSEDIFLAQMAALHYCLSTLFRNLHCHLRGGDSGAIRFLRASNLFNRKTVEEDGPFSS